MSDDLASRFARLKEKVLVKRPVLEMIIRKRGDKTLLDYANQYVDVNFNPTIPRRQQEALEVIGDLAKERFGKDIAHSVVRQMKKYYFVSTSDHVGPLIHPFFLNANLLTATSTVAHNDPLLQNIIVLACGNISFNNSSYPRGLFFHNYKNGQLQTHRLPFLSAKPDPHTIYCMPPYNLDAVKKVQKALREKKTAGEVDEREYNKIHQLLEEVYADPEILACKSYSEQCSKTNLKLWPKFFEASGVKLPNLIHLEQEEVVVKLLTKFHLTKDTIIWHMLYDPEYEHYINTYFEGIFGSFSRKDSSGTYLFWALPKGHRDNIQLWRKGNYLVSKDESYKIELHPETIKAALESKELIPSLLLNFATISFYHGIKCLGGFNQVNYLTLMKNNYIKMNADLGNYRSIETCARAQTKEMNDGLSLAFMEYGNKEMALASGLDLHLYGEKDSWDRLMDVTKNITFDEALNPLMPEIYRITYDQKVWEQDLLSVTDKDINELTHLDQKIKGCIKLPA